MSDNQLAYLARCTASRVSTLGLPERIAFHAAEFSTTGFSAVGAAPVFANAVSVNGDAVNGTGVNGDAANSTAVNGDAVNSIVANSVVADNLTLVATKFSQPKQGHTDLAGVVMTDDARGWASRPRRLSLAR